MRLFATLAALLCASGTAGAQETVFPFRLGYNVPACDEIDSGVEFKNCLGEAYESADRKLNSVYQAALDRLRSEESGLPERRQIRVDALREAQRAWVAYRDSDCEGSYGEELWGGAYRGIYVIACHGEKTRLRTAELRSRFLEE